MLLQVWRKTRPGGGSKVYKCINLVYLTRKKHVLKIYTSSTPNILGKLYTKFTGFDCVLCVEIKHRLNSLRRW